MKTMTVLLALALTACASNPEQTRYEIADGHARWLDTFHAAQRACQSAGGVIVQDRHQPDSIRVGADRVEVGTRYWCAR